MSGLLLPDRTVVVVISGPGGVGKGTLVRELVDSDDRLWLSRSWTTRARRDGEAPDAYRFVTPAEFQAHIDRDGFLEWVDFLDYRQGSPRPTPPAGSDVLFEIDVEGAARIHDLHPDAVLVFVVLLLWIERRARRRQAARGRFLPAASRLAPSPARRLPPVVLWIDTAVTNSGRSSWPTRSNIDCSAETRSEP